MLCQELESGNVLRASVAISNNQNMKENKYPKFLRLFSRLTIVFTIQNVIYYAEDCLAWASKNSVDLEYRKLPTWRKYN